MQALVRLSLLFLTGIVFAEQTPIAPPVTSVDLYQDYAKIERSQSIEINKRIQTFTLSIPDLAIDETIKVSSDNEYMIIKESKVVRAVRTEEEKLNNPTFHRINNKLNMLTEQDQAAPNKQIKEKILFLTLKKKRLLRQLNKPYKKLIISVETPKNETAQLSVQYETTKSGWSSHYLVRLNKKAAIILYSANLYHQSLESWENIKLTIHSGKKNQPDQNMVITTKEHFNFDELSRYSRIILSRSKTQFTYTLSGNEIDLLLKNNSHIPFLKGRIVLNGQHKEKIASLIEIVPPGKPFSVKLTK